MLHCGLYWQRANTMRIKTVYQSIIGQPYFWQRGNKWRCKYRGHVFWVPHRNVSRETLDALAAKAEQAMLEATLKRARRMSR